MDKVGIPVDARMRIEELFVKVTKGEFEPKELKCNLTSDITGKVVKGKYVVISTGATANFKLWNNPKGFRQKFNENGRLAQR